MQCVISASLHDCVQGHMYTPAEYFLKRLGIIGREYAITELEACKQDRERLQTGRVSSLNITRWTGVHVLRVENGFFQTDCVTMEKLTWCWKPKEDT